MLITNAIVCYALLLYANSKWKPKFAIVCKSLTRVSQRMYIADKYIEIIGFRQFPAKDTKIPAYSRQI